MSRAPACFVNVCICPSQGCGGGEFQPGVVAAAFGDVQVADILYDAMTAVRTVARLAGPLPVRLVEASSPRIGSRT